MQAAIEYNKQYMKGNKQDYDEKMMMLTEAFKEMISPSKKSIKDHINTLKSAPTQKESPNPPDLINVVPDNRRAPPLGDRPS